MNIVLGHGLSDFYFGMSVQQLIDRLGMPDKEYQSDRGDPRLQYYDLQGEFWFRHYDLRLHWIVCSHSDLTIFERSIINSNKEELVSFISSRIDDRLEIRDCGSFESYYFENHCLELQFEFDLLEQVCFGHFFDKEDKPIWKL